MYMATTRALKKVCKLGLGDNRNSCVVTGWGVLCLFWLQLGTVFLAPAFGAEQDPGQLEFVNPGVTTETNIHFDKRYCTECHTDLLGNGKKASLRFKDFTLSCRCHGYTPDTYRHPVNIVLSPEKQKKIPEQFPLAQGRITCATCHDFRLHCLGKKRDAAGNTAFLRTGHLLSRTALCYQCHDEKKSPRIDPHNQLDKHGNIIEDKCLYCHVDIPDVIHGRLRKKDWGDQVVRLIGNLDVLCYRCHALQAELHPLSANHYIKPSSKIARNIQLSEQEYGIILPLDDSGTITCITCHNPHEKGVIPEKRAGAAGAGAKGRLRLPAGTGNICLACHRGK